MADIFPASIKPHRITTIDIECPATITVFERKNEQRIADRHDAIEHYSLSWKMMTLAEMQTLIDHYKERKGQVKSFVLIDDRLATQKRVRFEKDSLRFKKKNHYFVNVSIEVQTC